MNFIVSHDAISLYSFSHSTCVNGIHAFSCILANTLCTARKIWRQNTKIIKQPMNDRKINDLLNILFLIGMDNLRKLLQGTRVGTSHPYSWLESSHLDVLTRVESFLECDSGRVIFEKHEDDSSRVIEKKWLESSHEPSKKINKQKYQQQRK